MLLSSHLLREIEVIADDLVVIGQGRIVAQGSQVRAAGRGRHARTRHRPHPAGPPGPCAAGAAVVTTPIDGGLRVDADPELVGRTAHRAGVVLRELRAADGPGLEEMFLELTADTTRDETAREGAAA